MPLLTLGALLVAIMIGFRFEVGGDWFAYEQMFSFSRLADLESTLSRGDPGYQALNWVIARIGGEIWLVNLVCGAIFSWGLLRFARVQPDPWLAMLVAIPYLVVVVAMAYSRQGVAIGILMAGLAGLQRNHSVLKFTVYVFIAALFHKTAVVVLPLVAFASHRNLIVNVLVAVAALILFYDVLIADSVESMVRNYIDEAMSSEGAMIRVVMSLIPALVFFARGKSLEFTPTEYRLWRNFSLAAVVLMILLFVLSSSTVVDRLALYILPLQIVILSRVFVNSRGQALGRLTIGLYSLAVLFTWLNFARHAELWLPYQFYPLA